MHEGVPSKLKGLYYLAMGIKRAICRALSCMRLPALLSVPCLPIDCTDIGRLIESLGFQQINPPSTAAGPGSVVYIKQQHPLRVGMICSLRHSLGSHFVPREHPTSQRLMNKTRRRHFALGADVMEQVKADASLVAIKNVCVTLSNPKIYMIDDTDVHHNIQYRSDVCKYSIARRVEGGFRVSMISETLEGDVTYSVTWENSAQLSAKAKLDLLSSLRAKLRLGTAEIAGNAIVGRALVWGIIDDRWLAQASMVDMLPADYEPLDRNPIELRAIPSMSRAVSVDPQPEVPMKESTNPGNRRYR